MSQGLVFLHLSDIHFSKRSSRNYDPDLDLRRELVADAVRMKDKVETCSGILVSGDVAFSGKAEEYNKARDWLRELCHRLDCPEESVWVIPGNHDVDREAFRKSTFIQLHFPQLCCIDFGEASVIDHSVDGRGPVRTGRWRLPSLPDTPSGAGPR